MEGNCDTDLVLPGNFPFGSPDSARYVSLNVVHALIQNSSLNCQSYVDRYFEMHQIAFPVLNAETFRDEVAEFWNAPNRVDLCWLAQYLVVLGLGAFATNRDSKLACEFFLASEACIAKTPFMFRPTLSNIRALCLMVIAKQVANATCWALDSCWNVMGIVVRLGVMMELHHDWMPGYSSDDICRERKLRKRLWTIIVYIDIQVSLITGQPSLLPNDALLSTSEGLSPPNREETLDDCWDSILPQSFPIIWHFLARLNSSIDQISYDEVLQYDLEIRQIMRCVAGLEGHPVLLLTLDVFFRRVLGVLHRHHALDIDAPALYPTSYWSSLECSLAILFHHRELAEETCLAQNVDLVGRPFMLDFFAAALTTCVHLLRTDAPLDATLTSEGTMPPRKTILDTLSNCLDILSREQNQSLCFRTGYRLLNAIFPLIPSTSSIDTNFT
jgi:hypothetical protein